MLRRAAGVLPELGAPSPLGTILFTASLAGAGGSRGRGISAAIGLLGYACRLSQPLRRPPDETTAQIISALAFTQTGELDYEVLAIEPARIGALLEHTEELASSCRGTASLAGCSAEAWSAFTEAATHHLGKTFVRHGVQVDEVPIPETFERLLRLGYAVRIVDEIARERPALRHSSKAQVAERARHRAGVDAESWRREAAAICLETFDPVVEHMLEAAARGSLLLDSAGQPSPESIDAAIASARFGFALRWCEHGSDNPGAPGPTEAEWHRTLEPSAARLVESIQDVVRYGYHGGPAALLRCLPGAGPGARLAVLETSNRSLALHGYLLHRIFEVYPGWLDAIGLPRIEESRRGCD